MLPWNKTLSCNAVWLSLTKRVKGDDGLGVFDIG